MYGYDLGFDRKGAIFIPLFRNIGAENIKKYIKNIYLCILYLTYYTYKIVGA